MFFFFNFSLKQAGGCSFYVDLLNIFFFSNELWENEIKLHKWKLFEHFLVQFNLVCLFIWSIVFSNTCANVLRWHNFKVAHFIFNYLVKIIFNFTIDEWPEWHSLIFFFWIKYTRYQSTEIMIIWWIIDISAFYDVKKIVSKIDNVLRCD